MLHISILTLLIVISIIVGVKKYNNYINPLTINAIITYGLFTLGSYFSTIFFRLDVIDFPVEFLDYSIWISVLAMGFFMSPFFFKNNIINGVIVKTLDKMNGGQGCAEYKFSTLLLLLLLCGGSYLMLILFSPGGTLWVTEPRQAYLNSRNGYGYLYTLYLWALIAAFNYLIFTQRPNYKKLIFLTSLFLMLSYFSGKKAFIMVVLVVAVIYYNFYIKSLSSMKIIAILLMMILTLAALIVDGADTDFLAPMLYFDYADLTSLFLYRFDEFGYYYGKAFITSFWVLVPRALYPDKPYEYGDSLVHEILFPGVAEMGHTAGYLWWTANYLDFGLIGVAFFAYMKGLVSKSVFEWYLRNKYSFFSFIVMTHFTLFEIWFFMPGIIVLIWCFLISKINKK